MFSYYCSLLQQIKTESTLNSSIHSSRLIISGTELESRGHVTWKLWGDKYFACHKQSYHNKTGEVVKPGELKRL